MGFLRQVNRLGRLRLRLRGFRIGLSTRLRLLLLLLLLGPEPILELHRSQQDQHGQQDEKDEIFLLHDDSVAGARTRIASLLS